MPDATPESRKPPQPTVSWQSDDVPGITRRKAGNGFSYRDAEGRALTGADLLRVRELVIPPAWSEVWISPDPCSHIQATGRDARGRKQYIYHPAWREMRDAAKFERMLDFGKALPRLRRRTDRDLRRAGAGRERVLAAAVRLLDHHPIRVGNDYYARTNHTFGLTTLRARHVQVVGQRMRIRFVGKSGKQQCVELSDPRLARAIRACEELPGQSLFQYTDDDGATHRIHSDELNAYIREAAGGDFTAKDFRTWSASALAARLLGESAGCESESPAVAERRVIKEVAAWLGNTVAVCRDCYIHPAVFSAFRSGELASAWDQRRGAWERSRRSTDELLFLHLLKVRPRRRAAPKKGTAALAGDASRVAA